MYRKATRCMVDLTDGLVRVMDGECNSIESSARDLVRLEGTMASFWLGRDEAVNKRVRAAPAGEIRVSKTESREGNIRSPTRISGAHTTQKGNHPQKNSI